MAKKLQGITIEIDGNTTGLTNALGKVNSSIGHLNTELKGIDKLLKLDPTNTELLAQKHDVLSSAIKETVEKLEKLKIAKEQADEKIASGKEDKNSASYRELEREIITTEQNLQKLTKQSDENEKAMSGNAKEIKNFSDAEEKAGQSTLKLGDLIKANLISEAIKSGIKNLASSIGNLVSSMGEWSNMSNALKEQEAKVTRVMKNTTDATDDEINSLINLTGAQEKLGVVSQETQLAGLQELGTYVTQKESLEKLLPVMNDMIAQQYGIGASMESASGIATMMGKVLGNGQVDALSRLGYKFDDAQKQVLKFGTEEEKVAMLSEIITQSVGGMNKALSLTDAGKVALINSHLDDMKKSIGGLISDIKNKMIGEFLPSIEEVSNAISGMISGEISIEDGMSKIGEGITSAVETIGAKLPELIDAGAKVLMSILDGIVKMLPNIMPTIVQVINTLVNNIIQLLPQILDAGIKILVELVKGIAQSLPDLIPTIVDAVLLICETIIDNIDLIIDAGIDIIFGLIDGIINAMPKLIDKMPEIIDKLVMAISNNLPKLIEAGIKLTIKLAEGLIKAIPQMVSKIPEIINSLQNGLLNYVYKIKDVGKELITGLWNGIKEKWEGLKKKVEELGNGIVNKFKSVFGIKSPSRVMRDEVGKYLADGIGVGVEKEVPNVIKDVNNAMNTLTRGIQASVNPVINPTANSNPLILQIENFNNTRGTDVQSLAEELEFYRRNTALAKGGN